MVKRPILNKKNPKNREQWNKKASLILIKEMCEKQWEILPLVEYSLQPKTNIKHNLSCRGLEINSLLPTFGLGQFAKHNKHSLWQTFPKSSLKPIDD